MIKTILDRNIGLTSLILLVIANIIAIICQGWSPFLFGVPQVHRFSHSPLALGKQPLRPTLSCLSPKINFLSSLNEEYGVIKCNDDCGFSLRRTQTEGFVKSSPIICRSRWPSSTLRTLKRSVTGSTWSNCT